MTNPLHISRRRPVLKLLWFAGVATIVYFSASRAEDLIDLADISDKLGHFAAYGIVALIGFWAATQRRHRYILALAMVALGLILEIVQIYVPGRTFEFADWMADAAGVAIAAAIYLLLKRPIGQHRNQAGEGSP